jgi:hypothetical protein
MLAGRFRPDAAPQIEGWRQDSEKPVLHPVVSNSQAPHQGMRPSSSDLDQDLRLFKLLGTIKERQ